MDYPYAVYNNSYSKYSDISIDSEDSEDREYEINLLDTNKKSKDGCVGFFWEVVWWIKQKLKQMRL